jgi:hypothetical protein
MTAYMISQVEVLDDAQWRRYGEIAPPPSPSTWYHFPEYAKALAVGKTAVRQARDRLS